QEALRNLWFEKGDISKLLRGPRWMPTRMRIGWVVLGSLFRRKASRPPLRGDHMCAWLHGAMADMDKAPPVLPGADTLVPPDHALDLFVPITDFTGSVMAIPIGDPRVIYDRTHRHILAFHYDIDPNK